MKEPKLQRQEWLKALGEAEYEENPDALTILELTKLFGLSTTRTRDRVQKLLEEGKIKRYTKRIPRASGGTQPIAAYILQKK